MCQDDGELQGPVMTAAEGADDRTYALAVLVESAQSSAVFFVHHGEYAAPGPRIAVSCCYIPKVYGRLL